MTNATRVRCAHILVSSKEKALELIAKIEAGTSFSEIAKKESKCPSGSKGGDLGFFSRGQMVRPFELSAFALEKGAMTKQPVQTEFGWHIIKRLE